MLRNAIAVDEGASYLGEVALVPWDSPISQSGVLFYNTLSMKMRLAISRSARLIPASGARNK